MTTKQQRLHLTFVRNKTNYQSSLWGDTYLTPAEASMYLNQMLMTLKRDREKHRAKTAK